MTVTTAELREAPWEHLADMWHEVADCDEDRRAVEAESDRRERNARDRRDALAARRADAVTAEWTDAAHAQYLQAEAECAGKLVRNGSVIKDAWQLWSGPEWLARKSATEELCNFWDDHPRIPTVTEWRRQDAAGHRIQDDEREDTMTVQAHDTADRTARIREDIAGRAAQIHRELRGTAPAEVAVREPAALIATAETQNGAELLGYIAGYLGQYVAFPSVSAHVAVTLWVAHAAARDRDDTGMGPLIWRASPRLLVTAKENKSGKSTVLDLVTMLLRVPGRMPKVTPRAIAHKLGRKHQAVILDEAKLIFGAGNASKDLQGVLLAGYTPRALYSYQSGGADKDIPVFGPVAYAGKDELITDTNEQLTDLLDRSIVIRMRRPSRPMPEPDEAAEDDGELLGQSLEEWTSAVKNLLRRAARAIAEDDYQAGQEAPEQGDDADYRSPQIWRPLLAVAAVAGGPWPRLAKQAMADLTAATSAIEAADGMATLRKRAARFAPVGFLAAGSADEDTDDWEED